MSQTEIVFESARGKRSRLQYVNPAELVDHPNNPRVMMRTETVERIAEHLVRDGYFAEEHAMTVRSVNGHLEIVSGHHRKAAAIMADCDEVPVWVRDLSDEEANFALVTMNDQSELSPLERGIHIFRTVGKGAAGTEGGFREYARETGQDWSRVAQLAKAGEVAKSLVVELIPQFTLRSTHLYEISKAPRESWAELAEKCAAKDWTVKQTISHVNTAKRAAEAAAQKAADDAEKARLKAEEKAAGALAVFSSECNEWYTPQPIIEAARSTLGGFDLDPATCDKANETVRAQKIYTIEDDGLAQPWVGSVWCNPPYGRNQDNESNQALWSAKFFDEYDTGNVSAGVLLVTFVPDRSWFERFWGYPMCVFRQRVKFYTSNDDVPNSPTCANVAAYVGNDVERFAANFSQFGRILVPSTLDGITHVL